MINDVFLDMDETLLDFSKAERAALTQALWGQGVEASDDILQLYHEINLSQWKLLEEEKLTRDVLKVRRFALLKERTGLGIDPIRTAERYETLLGQGAYYKEGAQEVLETLQGSYRLYLFSNGSSSIQHSRIAGADMEKYFDGIYISEDVGADKPSPEYFRRNFDAIAKERGYGVDVSLAVMVGDRLSSDILGGKQVGLCTIWLNEDGKEPGEILPDHTIGHISQLPELLQQL